MADLPRSTALLRNVSGRMRLVAVGRRFYVSFLMAGGLYGVSLLVSRLAGLLPDGFQPQTLLAIPAIALLASVVGHRRPTMVEVARTIDLRQGTKDLFLTVSLFEQASGDYKPLVVRDAESKAPSIAPQSVVPYHCRRQLLHAMAASAVLLAGVLFLPQFDPFGRVKAAEQTLRQREQLAESQEVTRLRAAQLKRRVEEGQESKEVGRAIQELKSSFQKMKPSSPKENLAELAQHQKLLGEAWRKITAERLKEALAKTGGQQEFGGADRDRLQKWTRELQQGSTESLDKELAKLQADLQKLSETQDPVEKSALEKKLKKNLRDLEEFASGPAGSKSLSAALQRAMQQLEMSNLQGLSDEALQGVRESLELSELELQQLARSAKDLQRLEEALQSLQMAKRLNDGEKLDGAACSGCRSLKDYADLFAQLMGDLPGEGPGMRGPGIGQGGEAPEDDSLKTGFQTEQSKTALQAGKVLLSWKSKGESDRGDARQEYRTLVDNVKQGVSEAILQERIPPGYHEGIKKYFDSIATPDNKAP